jgi:hypothetical protein
MRTIRQILGLFVVLVSLISGAFAASKSQPEFDHLKSLAGSWAGKGSDGMPVHINYQVVSAGSAVMESIGEGKAGQMITVYHLDGDSLMMTHFCSAGNQPRMRADTSSTPRAIKFTLVDVTNLSGPDAGHMQAHSIMWKDGSHVTQEWVWRENGKERTETFELERQK